MNHRIVQLLLLASAFIPTAYAEDAPASHTVKITTTMSSTQSVESIEHALGRILDTTSSTIAAEIPARIQSTHVDVGAQVQKGDTLAMLDVSDMQLAVTAAQADVARNQALAKNQHNLVARYRQLAEEKFISTTLLEQSETQLVSLQKALQASRAQLKQAQHNVRRGRITAPMAGTIQQRFVAAGDYIGVGKPMFRIVGQENFTITLAIPETNMRQIHVGTPVRIHLPQDSQIQTATIHEINPAIGARSNALEARVRIPNMPHWRPGGSVIVDVITATHAHAVVVPEACVVLRPKGDVVYSIAAGRAHEITVQTGEHIRGYVEIINGLEAGVTLAETGAAFLSDGAAVAVTAP